MEPKFKLPTETVDLPSKGILYPEGHPLSSGALEMKYMTAKEEDILTNQNYIKNGTVIDRLLKSLIVTEGINYEDILVGDKNALMVAARILSYGADYNISYRGEQVTVDLAKVDNKPLDESQYEKGKNEFTFNLPISKAVVTFRLFTHKEEKNIEKELQGLKKLRPNESPEVTTRFKYMITSINGDRESGEIRDFVDNYLLARDARALRKEYSRLQPDLNLTFNFVNDEGREEEVPLPIGLDFFWPDAE